MWSMNLPAEAFPGQDRVGLFSVLAVLTAPVGCGVPLLFGWMIDRGFRWHPALSPAASLFLLSIVIAVGTAVFFLAAVPNPVGSRAGGDEAQRRG
jgi:hypothetical protein